MPVIAPHHRHSHNRYLNFSFQSNSTNRLPPLRLQLGRLQHESSSTGAKIEILKLNLTLTHPQTQTHTQIQQS